MTGEVARQGTPRLRWPERVLMLVTDRQRCGGRELVEIVAAAVAGGVNVVQLRERDLPARELLALARRLRGVTGGRALLIVNDRADVAVLCGADGVHLGERGLPTAAVRAWLPRSMVVGRSVHSFDAAREAQEDGADYVLAGTIFPSPSHPAAEPAGPAFLQGLASRVTLPILAIGGITAANVRACVAAGARGVAVVSAILESADPRAAAARLWSTLNEP